MQSFNELKLKDQLVSGLVKDNINKPTNIQKDTIPSILENKDVIGEAITGSGKTLAYILPAFERIDPESKELFQIVLAPTHELVVQINNVIKKLAQDSGISVRSTTIIGNVNIKRQIEYLKKKPHIIVGTPGRVLELIKMKRIKAHQVNTVVIDEGDKMLSDNNIEAVNSVIKTTLKDRQLLIFSASISAESEKRAKALMKEPIVIKEDAETINEDIEHLCLITYKRDRINTLRKLIHATKPEKAIVFINENDLIQEVVSKLEFHKLKAVGLYGAGTKHYRKSVMDQFKSGKANILVTSDITARGMDLKNITHVINLDTPSNLNEYIHRAGRTGRAGKKGTCISVITEKEIPLLIKLENMHGIVITPKQLYKGKLEDYQE